MGRRYIRAKDEMDSRGKVLLEWRRPTSVETAKVEASEAGALSLLIPRGEWEPFEIRREDTPELLYRLCTAASVRDVEDLFLRYGPLKESVFFAKYDADTVEDWIRLAEDVSEVFELLGMIRNASIRMIEQRRRERDKRVHGGLFFQVLKIDIESDAKAVLQAGETEDAPSTMDGRRLLVGKVERGLASARFKRVPLLLPDGGAVVEERPADLYSLIWKIVESTALDMEGGSGQRLRLCRYCGLWDTEDEPDLMREDKRTGEWYHHNCKRNKYEENRKKERDEREGREPKPRPGARKDGPQWYVKIKKDAPRGAS